MCLAHLALRRWVGGSPTPAVASGSATPAMAGEAGARLEETAQKGGQRRERSANEKKCQASVRTYDRYVCKVEVPPRNVVDLKSRGWRKLKTGNTGQAP